LVLPLSVALAVNYLDPHPQMAAPREGIQSLYFFDNPDFSKDTVGWALFVVHMTKEVAHDVAFPFDWFPVDWRYDARLDWIPWTAIAIGVAVSLARVREFRFALAVFLLIDLSGRLGANLLGWFPFGSVRYALSQVFGLQVMAGLGLADVLAGAAWVIGRIGSGTMGPRMRASFVWMTTVVFAASAARFGWAERHEQKWIGLHYAHDVRVIRNEYCAHPGRIYVTTDDQEMLALEFAVPDEFFRENTILYFPRELSEGATLDQASADRMAAGIAGNAEIFTVTFKEFTPENYTPAAYAAVATHRVKADQVRLWELYFATWRLEDGQP
jgi:hypothetical protein